MQVDLELKLIVGGAEVVVRRLECAVFGVRAIEEGLQKRGVVIVARCLSGGDLDLTLVLKSEVVFGTVELGSVLFPGCCGAYEHLLGSTMSGVGVQECDSVSVGFSFEVRSFALIVL